MLLIQSREFDIPVRFPDLVTSVRMLSRIISVLLSLSLACHTSDTDVGWDTDVKTSHILHSGITQMRATQEFSISGFPFISLHTLNVSKARVQDPHVHTVCLFLIGSAAADM